MKNKKSNKAGKAGKGSLTGRVMARAQARAAVAKGPDVIERDTGIVIETEMVPKITQPLYDPTDPDLEGLDKAQERPLYMMDPSLGGMSRPELISSHKAIYNISKGRLSCVAGKDYTKVDHDLVIGTFKQACANLGLETKTTIRNFGDRVWCDIDFPKAKIGISVGEEFTAGFRLVNSYDKTAGVMVIPRLVRLVCGNGMVMQVRGFVPEFNYHHDSKQVKQIEMYIESALNLVINSSDKLKKLVNDCIADSVEWSLAERILDNILKVYGKNHLDAIKGKALETAKGGVVTRWDIYNAITWYISHSAQLSPWVEQYLNTRALKVMNHSIRNMLESCEEIER